MSEYSHVILDLGDVLFRIRSEETWYREFMFPLIGDVDRQAFEALYHTAEHGTISDGEFKQRMEELSGRKFSMEDFENAWNGRLLDMPEVNMEIVLQLSKRYELYLLSNTNRIHWRSWSATIDHKFGWDLFEGAFNHCFYSHDLGVMKPDHRIYDQVHRAMGSPEASDCIFLDDSIANIKAAKAFGWEAVLVDDSLENKIAVTGLLDD